ncbi:serine protease inhibitor Kazal-type 9 isoform X1 [Tupaia chinensis]|uniref:serine protease inhibitor Kazal-type 9 isoform X1 n=1 Tax=Tupaia chinensis TaxID=246437 RepID=UPI0003C8E5F4|nr:serine protease inhibitor Kazal-type 9 isoform X1 [Tupaia chinensis]
MEKMKTFLVAILATGYFSNIFGDDSFKVISCSHYQKKAMQEKHICSIRVSPLCASNNVTYPNSCVYCFANISQNNFTVIFKKIKSQALNHTLKIQYNGKCSKAQHSQM